MMPKAGLQPPAPTGVMAPASWWEFYFSIYPLTHYIPIWRVMACSISVGANTSNTGALNYKVPIFAYRFSSSAFVTSSGAALTIPYRIGLASSVDIDFTQGTWLAGAVTGDGAGLDFTFPIPVEIRANIDYTVTIGNTVNAASPAITVDVAMHGIQPKRRETPLSNDINKPNWPQT